MREQSKQNMNQSAQATRLMCQGCSRLIPFDNFKMLSKEGHNAKAYNWDQTRPVFVFSCGRVACDAIAESTSDNLRKNAGLDWSHLNFVAPNKSQNQTHL